MPRIYNPRRRETPLRITPGVRKNRFYNLRLEEHQGIDDFLTEFQTQWEWARFDDVDARDGMIQLVRVLPSAWQGWASSLVLDYIDYGRSEIYGAQYLREILARVKERFRMAPAPPPGDYPTYEKFCSMVHHPFTDQVGNQLPSCSEVPNLNEPIVEPNLEIEESIGSNVTHGDSTEILLATADSGDLSSISVPIPVENIVESNLYGQPSTLEPRSLRDLYQPSDSVPSFEHLNHLVSSDERELNSPHVSSFLEVNDNQEEQEPLEPIAPNEGVNEEESEPEEEAEETEPEEEEEIEPPEEEKSSTRKS